MYVLLLIIFMLGSDVDARDYRDRLYERYAPHHRVYRYNPYVDPEDYYYGQPDFGYYYEVDDDDDDGYYRRGKVPGLYRVDDDDEYDDN